MCKRRGFDMKNPYALPESLVREIIRSLSNQQGNIYKTEFSKANVALETMSIEQFKRALEEGHIL
jgi:hypothetical protein